MEQPQRSQLELYSQVIAAYRKAGFCSLSKYVFKRQPGRVITMIVFTILFLCLLYVCVLDVDKLEAQVSEYISRPFLYFIFSSAFLLFIVLFIIEPAFKKAFEERTRSYGGLVKIYGKEREFYRYILFHDELKKFRFRSEHVLEVEKLFDIEKHTLGAYIAKRPLISWTAVTLTAILGNSAKNWDLDFVVMIFCICVVILFFIRYQPPLLTSAYRRQYELHHWLAWYEADAEPTGPTPDNANPS